MLDIYYNQKEKNTFSSSILTMGVGRFTRFVGKDFNFATEKECYIGNEFLYENARYDAQLIYTSNGIITYDFTSKIAKLYEVFEMTISLELCSEAPYYNDDYLTNITFWVNGCEILTYLSLGDYGDHRGILNPLWWSRKNTQHGRMFSITITENELKLNGISKPIITPLSKLNLNTEDTIQLEFGKKLTDEYIGGFNVFGKKFGDIPQDISIELKYY